MPPRRRTAARGASLWVTRAEPINAGLPRPLGHQILDAFARPNHEHAVGGIVEHELRPSAQRQLAHCGKHSRADRLAERHRLHGSIRLQQLVASELSSHTETDLAKVETTAAPAGTWIRTLLQ